MLYQIKLLSLLSLYICIILGQKSMIIFLYKINGLPAMVVAWKLSHYLNARRTSVKHTYGGQSFYHNSYKNALQ